MLDDRLVDRLPRPVAFVLGGGASFGAVQVGMLRALAEARIVPDLIVGTSVGSINGAVLAEDPVTAADRLTATWRRMRAEEVFPKRALPALRALRQRHSLVGSDGLRAVIARELRADSFEDLAVPFVAVATDLTAGIPVHLDSGPLVPALMASCALPGVYPPVTLDGQVLVDGGVVENVPVGVALERGAASAVVLDCGVYGIRETPPTRFVESVVHVIGIMLRGQAVRDMKLVSTQMPVVYVAAPFPAVGSLLEFGGTDRLIHAGLQSGRRLLADVEIDGPGLYGRPPWAPA